MPWKESTPMSQRQEFVLLANNPSVNFSELCQRFGISRKTGYKWCKRHQDQGLEGLQDRSRRPLKRRKFFPALSRFHTKLLTMIYPETSPSH
jgi:transposase-like protein